MNFNQMIPELSCKNLEKTLDFYKLLGFKVEYAREENKFALFDI